MTPEEMTALERCADFVLEHFAESVEQLPDVDPERMRDVRQLAGHGARVVKVMVTALRENGHGAYALPVEFYVSAFVIARATQSVLASEVGLCIHRGLLDCSEAEVAALAAKFRAIGESMRGPRGAQA